MGNPKLTDAINDILDNRSYIHHFAGPRGQEPFSQEVVTYLFRFYFLSLVTVTAYLFWLHWKKLYYHLSSSCTWQRSRPQRRRSHAAPSRKAHRGPKSPARVGPGLFVHCLAGFIMAYIVNHKSALNPQAPPWWPEGSGSATQPSEANQLLDYNTLSTAKPSGTGPKSIHLDSDKPQRKKKAYIRALKRA